MTEPLSMDQAFIRKLTDIILANLDNEEFGVSELIIESGLSRHFVTTKLHEITNKNISQFIREVRLQRALEMLKAGKVTASEVAYKVGFGSPAYFNTCFHEHFGFTPGHVKKELYDGAELNPPEIPEKYNNKKAPWQKILLIPSGILLLGFLVYITYSAFIKKYPTDDGITVNKHGKSIVILPFINVSNDPENQWFAEGITEDIRNNLYRIGELFVISKTTSEYLSGKKVPLSELVRKFNTSYVLEGIVLREGNMVRIFVKLIDARNDRLLFSERFENEMIDIFKIHSDIAMKVADKLEAVITSKEIGQIEKIQTQSAEAYDYYLYGRFFLNKRTSEGFTKSIEYFEKAITADPEYALAWAGLADAHYLISWWEELQVRDLNNYIKSKNEALKALGLDPNLAEAHTVLGALLTWYEWNWEEARRELRLAVELNPNFSSGHSYYFELLNILGENKEAREQLDIALQLDPFVPIFHIMSGWSYYNEGKYRESVNEFQKAYELDPYFNPYRGFFNCYVMLNNYSEALEALNKGLKTDSIESVYPENLLADIHSKSGMDWIWNWLIETELKKSKPDMWGLPFWYVKIGNNEKALDLLEKAFDRQIIQLPSINNNSDLDILRDEPRFQVLIKKMKLSGYQKRLAKE